MPGLQNKRNTGTYLGPHTVMKRHPTSATALGLQQAQTGPSHCLFEHSPMDHLGTPMDHTLSSPTGSAIHGSTCGPGNGVLHYSRILIIDGFPAQQNLTKNSLYGGNCPMANMAMPSSAQSYFFVGA